MNKELLTFSTNRLTIRPLERKDYKVWQAAVKGTLPPKNTFDTYNKEEVAPTYRSFTQILRRSKENISRGVTVDFFAFRKDDGHMIGGSQLWLIQRGDCQRATLGYWVLNQHWSNGYGYEIGKGTIEHGIRTLRLNRIEAEILPENKQSIHLSLKLGMKSEGIRRQALFEDGKWADHEVLAITASDLGIHNRQPD